MKNICDIIAAAKRYNGCTDLMKPVYGISQEDMFDAIIIAPSWVPEKILANYDPKISIVAEKACYSSYIVEFSGIKVAWIKCGISSSNVIDATISLADSRVEPVIFLGSVGALRADIEIGELCTPSESIACDGASLYLREKLSAESFGRRVRSACEGYIENVIANAKNSGIDITRRSTFCTDSLICEYAHLDEIRATGAELIEMETAAFYECLAMMGKNGMAIMCVSDNSASGVSLLERTPDQRARYDECRTRLIPEVIRIAAAKSAFSTLRIPLNSEIR